VDSDSEIQEYNVYPMLYFHRKFSSGIIVLKEILTSHRASTEEKELSLK